MTLENPLMRSVIQEQPHDCVTMWMAYGHTYFPLSSVLTFQTFVNCKDHKHRHMITL